MHGEVAIELNQDSDTDGHANEINKILCESGNQQLQQRAASLIKSRLCQRMVHSLLEVITNENQVATSVCQYVLIKLPSVFADELAADFASEIVKNYAERIDS